MYGWGGQREPFSSTMWVLGTNRISQDWSHFEGLETFFLRKKNPRKKLLGPKAAVGPTVCLVLLLFTDMF